MAFDPQELISNFNQTNGFSYPNYFYVNITTPPWVSSTQSGNTAVSLIPFVCDSTVLPGIEFDTTEIIHHGIGLSEKRPTKSNFNLQPLSFYCDAQGQVINFFDQWSQNITNFNTNSGDSNAVNNLKMFEFQYPTQYWTTIDIYHLDTQNNQILHYQLLNAWPIVKREVNLDWGGEITIMKLNVMFHYLHWTTDAIQVGTQADVYQAFSSAVTSNIFGTSPLASLAYTIGSNFIAPFQISTILNDVLGAPVFGGF